MKVLVVTETDSCCGPMAAAFLHDYSTSIEVVSAGRNPAETIEPLMITAMKECLVDLSGYQPKSVTEFDFSAFDAVYECPDFSDFPAPTTLEKFRELRDFIKNEAYQFFLSIRQSPQHPSTLNSQLSTIYKPHSRQSNYSAKHTPSGPKQT